MVIYNITTNGPSTELVIELINDTVFVEPNAVGYVSGAITMDATCKDFNDRFLSYFIGKRFFKPAFKGTGKIYMKATVGTYHKFTIREESNLIVDKYAFIACRETISVRPRVGVSLGKFLSGTPMVDTIVHGNGNVVVHMPGPVQELKLNNEKFVAYKSDIAGYSDTIKVTRERAGNGWLAIANKMVRVYRGSGSLYFTPHPNKDAKSNK